MCYYFWPDSTSLPSNTNAPIWSISIEIHGKFLLGRLLFSQNCYIFKYRSLPHCSTWLASSHLQFQPLSIRLKYLKTFLTWWPWPLTFDLDLRTWPRYPSIWPTYQNSGLYVCPFKQESGNRHTHTHRHTMSKLLHPSLTRGVIKGTTFVLTTHT